ncbi:MAG: helix-turn-helix transcriptional regulator [Oscillospiraceae bacterium]|nr:helix-turn-helix transcriptional regulator [Oscillospiraceae bacterium]
MNRLKELRLKHGYKTQQQLASVLFVNQTAVSQWERGVTVPSSTLLVKLSQMYGVSIDYILGNDDTEKEKPATVSGDGQDPNTVRIAGRDGSLFSKRLTDEQLAALKSIIEQMPEADADYL